MLPGKPDRLAGLRVPQPARLVHAGREDGSSVGTEQCLPDVPFVLEHKHRRPGQAVPNAGRPVITGGEHEAAVRAEGHAPHAAGVAQAFHKGLASPRVPKLDRVALAAAGDYAQTVETPGQRLNFSPFLDQWCPDALAAL